MLFIILIIFYQTSCRSQYQVLRNKKDMNGPMNDHALVKDVGPNSERANLLVLLPGLGIELLGLVTDKERKMFALAVSH